MILKIRKSDDPILRQPAEKVTDFGHEFQFLVDNMIETMRKNNGIGLAAPQVGVSKKFFVVEFEGDKESNLPGFPLTVLCNPEIVEKSKSEKKMVEGCLSFPGLELLIKRPDNIVIKGQDRYGKPIKIKADNIYARVMQHEFDHLSSTLFIDHMEEIKIIFIGTGTLGIKSLEFLANDPQYKILAVVTGKVGKVTKRGQALQINPILETAKKFKLHTLETDNIKNPKIIDQIKKLKPELGIMADFGQIVPEEILGIPKHGIINIHPSLLPKYRGPSPIQQAILDGEKITGVSLMLTSKKMDAGGIISQVKVELSQGETTTTLKNFLSEIGASLLLNSIPYYIAGDLKPLKQKDEDASYTRMFISEDGLVDSDTKDVLVERKIRAFDTWPKVHVITNQKRVQIISAHFEEDGTFIIDQVKPEGKKTMSYTDWKQGHKEDIKFQE